MGNERSLNRFNQALHVEDVNSVTSQPAKVTGHKGKSLDGNMDAYTQELQDSVERMLGL
jgi:hypothetical protein